MKVLTVKCPECGASLDNVEVKDGKADFFCSFCGHHIVMEDENHQHITTHYVDEARMKELEFREKSLNHKLELEKQRIEMEKERFEYLKTKHAEYKRKFLISLGAVIAGLVFVNVDFLSTIASLLFLAGAIAAWYYWKQYKASNPSSASASNVTVSVPDPSTQENHWS